MIFIVTHPNTTTMSKTYSSVVVVLGEAEQRPQVASLSGGPIAYQVTVRVPRQETHRLLDAVWLCSRKQTEAEIV